MYVLILTLFLAPGAPGAMTTADFTSKRACEVAANAWATQVKNTYGPAAHFTFLCTPK